jgi:YihY family inner membrane protein
VPGHASAITDQVSVFLAHRNVVGWVGVLSLLFFSAMAFGVLETTMARVFHHRSAPKRHPLASALIPYAFVVVLGFGLLVVTLITGAIEVLGRSSVQVVGHTLPFAAASRVLLHLLGTGGLALILTALYMVLPAQRISLRAAASGAMAATLLWEVVRRVLVWYFASVSMVNFIYGPLATAVVLLATLEAASIILLLGAEVVATLERRARFRMEHVVSAHDARVPVRRAG